MSVHYRIVQADDYSQLLSLLEQLGYQLDLEDLTKNINSLRQRESEVFVAEQAGKIIGVISALLDVRLAGGINGEITSLVVDEQERGQGVGKGLIQTAEAYLSSKVTTIQIRANSSRTNAHAFYQSLGYEETKVQKIFKKNLNL